MKALFNGTIKEFKKTTKSELQLNKWKVFEMNIEDRYDWVQDNSYVNKLHEIAKSNDIKYDKYEIISWLDSQSIMLKIINKMEKLGFDNLLNKVRIIQEFHIPFTNKRADYLLVYENKIIIIEFSYNKFENKDYHYNIKLNQVIGYKELISNILPKDIDIATYTFLLYPEDVDENSNKEQIENFVEYIKFFMEKKSVSAYEELKLIRSN